MRTGKFSILIVSTIMVLFVCCGLPTLLFLYEVNLDEWFEALSTSRFLPDAQIRFDQVYDQIRGASQDTLVSEESEPLYVPSAFYTSCIRGTANIRYRTERDYQSVNDDYMRLFERMNQGQIIRLERDPRGLIYRAAMVNIVVEPESAHVEANSIIYSVRVSYAEPSVRLCWG
jgi:hypothetical protein